ncbi:MAG: hypothetical protein K2H37_06690 [Lachnospiraceae bacterium]|nr:hypothetical protein [Lachnospiraceae bacterium]
MGNSRGNIEHYNNVIESFRELDLSKHHLLSEDGTANWSAIAEAIGDCDDTALSYFKTLDDGNGTINNQAASLEGLSQHLGKAGNGFSTAALKTTLLNSALNAGIFMLASVAIQAIATGIDNYIHRVDNARERTAELFDEFQQRNDTLSSHKKTVSESASRYDQLSKGVDLSTNENRSLSTREYEEFLAINRQLADSFPELAKGIDENGNAILSLGTKGLTAKEQLEELLQTEEDLNNFKTAQGLEESFTGVYTYIEEAAQASAKLEGTVADSDEALSHLQEIAAEGIRLGNSPDQPLFSGNTDNGAELDYLNALTSSAREFWKSLDGSRRVELAGMGIDDATLFTTSYADDGAFDLYSQAYMLTGDEKAALETIIRDNVSGASGALLDSIGTQTHELQAKVLQGENAWRDFIPSLVSGMQAKQTFQDLTPDLQDVAIQIVEGLDYSCASAMNEWDPDPYAYIRDKFIVPMGNLNAVDQQLVKDSFQNLLSLDTNALSINELDEKMNLYINSITGKLDMTPVELKAMLGFDPDDTKERLEQSIRTIADSHGIVDRDQYASLSETVESFTVKEAELWLEATRGAENAEQAARMYEDALEKAGRIEMEPPDAFTVMEDMETKLKPALQSLKSAYETIFSDGFHVDSADFEALESIRSSIDSLSKAEGLDFRFDMESFNRFASIMTDTGTTQAQAEQAFNDLALSIYQAGAATDGLTQETAGLFSGLLASLGVVNADELAMRTLAESKGAAVLASHNLADAAQADMFNLLNEGQAAGVTREMIYQLAASEIAYNTTGLSVEDKISQLGKLATAYGDTATSAIAAAAADRVANGHGDYETVLSDMMAGLKRQADSFKIEFDPIKPGKTGSTGSAKSAKTETNALSSLNSEMDKLQSSYKSLCDIRDTYNQNGKITVDQYQELTNMGFTFLSQLVDENGQLGLNASAFERLSQAKLQEMQIQMARNAADTINGLKTEAAAVEYLTYANEQLRDAALGAAEAQLEAAVANANARGGKQAEAAQQIYQGYQAAKQMAGKVDFSFTPASSSASSPAAKAEPAKTETSSSPMDAYNKEKSLLEHMLAMDQISKGEYYEKLLSLAKSSFAGDEEHQNQIWDAEESYHDYLESIKETYNWIEIFLENLSRKASALIDKAGKFISWSKKNAMINRAVKATDKQISGQNNAYVYYAEKARRVGLSNTYINKIQNGTLTMEDMQNESLSDKIEKYQEWYDKMTACQDAVSELYDQERDLIRQKLDNVLAYYNDLDSYMSSIVSKMDSFISLTDDMGRRSSLSDLLEQFAAVNEQAAHFQSQTTITSDASEKNRFGSSERVKAAEEKEKQELISSLEAQKSHAESGVKNTGTYKKIELEIQKAKDDEAKKKAQADAATGTRFAASRQAAYDKAKKTREELEKKLNLKLEALAANASANTAAEYAQLYDTEQTLLARQEEKKAQGKTLSQYDAKKLADTQARMAEITKERKTAINELTEQLDIANGSKPGETEAKKLEKQLEAITGKEEDKDNRVGTGIAESATYQRLLKDIADKNAAIEKETNKYNGKKASKAQLAEQQKNLDKMNAQLAAYNAKKAELEAHATAGTIGEYSKVYDKWRKLEDKLNDGKVLSAAEWKQYNSYSGQLKQFADERDDTVKSLNEQLEKLQNPGDKAANINREYEEASEEVRESYQDQIDSIDTKMKASNQYKNLLAKKQRLENKRDSAQGLTADEEKKLKKFTAELEALEKGGTGDNIASYMRTWEQWYTLQQKINDGKTLTVKEASNYDNLKSQLESWNTEKQSQINDLLSLMEDDLETLGKTRDENLSDAESEVNSYYSKVYGLAKQIAEYNLSALNEQLSCLDACISYYSDLVSLYDRFSGEKLTNLLTDLDEGAFSDQVSVYEKYLDTLSSKYDATLSQINEYKQLLEAIDTNDFQSSMALFQKAMETYQASGNTEMADRLQSVLDLLNERAVDADNWGEYADLWASEWEQALADAKSGLIETAGSIQEINDALREVRFSGITDAIEELNRADGLLSSMSGLIQDAWLYENDGLSEYGKAKAALLVSQLENAQNRAEEYLELTNRIRESQDTYASDTAWQEALTEASQNYYNTLSDAASLENALMDLMKQAKEEEVSGWKDIISARKEALQAKKSYYDYDRNLKEKNKNIDSLKAELAALNDISTAQAKARRAKLEAQLAQAEEELESTRAEHTFSISTEALDDYAKTLEEALQESTETVQESLESQKKIIEEAKELYRTSTDAVEETMQKVTDFYRLAGAQMDSFLAGLPEPEVAPNLNPLPDPAGTLAGLPSSDRESVEIVNHYDALLRVDGNVDKDTLPGLQEILEKSYHYTTQKQYTDLKKIGYSLH